jgi:MinD-like ATPase involved in chromosome partitioning or flagellar assembly
MTKEIAMTEKDSEHLTALLFARPEISTQMMSVMHMASGRKVVVATFLPIFNLTNAATTMQQLAPQVVIIDALVDGFSLPQIVDLKQKAVAPFIVVGLAQAGSTEMEEMLGVGLDAAYPLPLNQQTYARIEEDLPKKYEEIARGWGKGAWGAAAPEAIKAATAAAGGAAWEKKAIAAWSPKGGVGKTVVACELAAMLAAIGGRDVVLIDANMNGGHIKTRLNVDAPNGLLNAASTYHTHKGHPSLESDAVNKLKAYLYPMPGTPNLKVLPGVLNMEQSLNEAVVGDAGIEFMNWTVSVLKRQFDFVIIDLGSSINVGVHQGVIRSVDFVVALCEPDLTSVADIKEGVHRSIINRMGMNINRFGLVINKWQDGLGVSLKEASNYANISAMGIIPNDPTGNVTLAGNEGQSYVARFANKKGNPKETEQTLHGFASLAGQFYSPIAAAWSERLKRAGKKGLFRRG